MGAGWVLALGAAAQTSGVFEPVTDEMLRNPDPADWLMWRRTLDSWGHSPLDQIDKRNVADLRLVWTRALGPGMQEGTPLVYAGVMYFPSPSDVIQALEAATGDVRWEYRRSLPPDLGEYFPVPSINRNLSIYGDTIIDTSADDFVFGSTRARVSSAGKRRSSTTSAARSRRRARSSRTARSSPGAAASPKGARQPASSRRTMRGRAASSGAAGRSRRPASRTATRGAICPTRRVGTSAVGSCRATIRSSTSSTPAPPSRRRRRNSRSRATSTSSCTTTRRSRSMPTPARSSGTTSTSSIIGTSIIRSSACSSRRRSLRTGARLRGSIRDSARAKDARSSRVSRVRPVSCTRSTRARASSFGRGRP
jgi:hypothetical protein